MFAKVCVCFPFTNVLFKSVCKKWREEGWSEMWHYRRWRSKQSAAYPCSRLCSMGPVPVQVPYQETIGPFDTNKSSVFCLCGSSFVLVECCLWPITGLGWLSSSECVPMFLQVFFVVSSHCFRASVACGYVFLLCLLVEVNRELQKHLLRQHKHSHTLEIIIELRMPSICLIWCVCVLF